jgi:hypothetical protein
VPPSDRSFRIKRSERCFRLLPEELDKAPRTPGVYEFLAYDPKGKAEVLFVGLALPGSVHGRLLDHLMGNIRPTVDELRRAHADVYFDFIADADAGSPDDLKDIAGELMIQHNPRHNLLQNPPSSGRYRKITLTEL